MSVFYLSGFIGTLFGVLFTCLLFYVKGKEKAFKFSKQCASYEHALQSVLKDLDRELGVRKDLEERLRNNEEIFKKLYAKISISEERLSSLLSYRQKYDDVSNKLRLQREISIVQESEIKQMTFRLKEKNFEILEKEKFLLNFEKRFSEKFEILVNRVFEYSGRKIDTQNQLSLDKLLSPLRLQLDGFSKDIQKKFSKEEYERHSLSHEIHNLQRLNTTMAQETINLTKALKGSNKFQGIWGEVILHRILEASGMREGHEFHTQANTKTSDGRRVQPDVIVHLPGNKDVIIDAKTSLLSYEKYFNAENGDTRKVALANHISSLRSHIKLLAKKDYQSAYNNMQTLDYVLLFVPIESAFILALNKEASLLTEAIEHNIMLVSPTTLLVALRIINNLWSYEYQNRHTKEIADRASRLYDKLRLFVDDINKLGQYIGKVEDSYRLAKKKLFEGSGNLISQAESFRLFGVKVKRPIISKKNVSSLQDFSTGNIHASSFANSKNLGDVN